MRRLVLGLLLPALMTAALLLPATAAAADAPADSGIVLLAAEGGGGELPGRQAPDPNDPENPNPPEEYEQNFLWGAAVGLTAGVVGLVLLLGGLYYLLVQRPRNKAAAAS